MNKFQAFLAITALSISISSAQPQILNAPSGSNETATGGAQAKQRIDFFTGGLNATKAGNVLIEKAERNEVEVQKLQSELANQDTQYNQYSEVVNSYCTVSAVSFHWWNLQILTYTTLPNRPCDVKEYVKISVASVKEQLRGTPNTPMAVTKGGTHFRTMDVARTGLPEPFIYIGNIKMRPLSRTRVTIFDILLHPSLLTVRGGYGGEYEKIRTQEASYYRWDPGSTVYYLEGPAPEKEVFVMTAFTSQMLPTLNRGNLRELGETLKLPKGWRFKSKTINHVIEYRSGGITYDSMRMIDEYGNFYLQIDPSKLKEPT